MRTVTTTRGVLIGVHPYFTFIPNHLRCSACGLELDGRDELDADGIAEPWTLETSTSAPLWER
jgi:hypothetical protein